MDSERTLHLSRFDLEVNFGDNFDVRQLKPSLNMTLPKSLENFFGCRLGDTFGSYNFKGIFYSYRTHRFYVFIDQYYLKGVHDLDKHNFRLSPDTLKEAKTIQFYNISNVMFDRGNSKYVKIINKRKLYLTINPYQTYRMDFANGEEKRNGRGQLVATEGDISVHSCTQQIFVIDHIVFCFEMSVSFLVGTSA